jgi:hypothetical protein
MRFVEKRLKRAGILTEWRTFAAMTVNSLGMPEEAMPLYSPSHKWSKKANRILQIIFETGNFGNNRDKSYYQKYSYFVYKLIFCGGIQRKVYAMPPFSQ